MKKFLHRVQQLQQTAVRFKQAVDAAPGKAQQFRDTVQQTTTQLQQLRAGVQDSVAALKSDSDDSLARHLTELNAGIPTLARAGYDVTGVDVEPGAIPRLIVHLDRVEGAATESLHALLSPPPFSKLLTALLRALQQAEALEGQVQVGDLDFRGLIVHLGALPTVRLCWRRDETEAEAETAPAPQAVPGARPTATTTTITTASATAGGGVANETMAATCPPTVPVSITSPYGAGSYFDRPATVTARRAAPAVETPVAAAAAPTPAAADAEPALTGDWRKDALARFKKMPNLSPGPKR
jgi:hypothetical protein